MAGLPTRPEKLVNNLISGEYKTKEGAAIAAGYSPNTARDGKSINKVLKSEAVEIYLKKLDKMARARFKSSLHDKVMETYLDGLEATKLFGKDAIEHPDYMARKAFADKFAEFFGWTKGTPQGGGSQNQFNFFMFKKEEREDFNQQFEGFLRKFYHENPVV